MTEILKNVPATEPAGYRVGWAPDEERIVVQLGDPEAHMTVGLTIEMAASLGAALTEKAHQHRANPGEAPRMTETMAETEAQAAAEAVADHVTDAKTLALLRNDLRGLSKADIGALVAELTSRMGVDPALAPIDLIPDRKTGALRVYVNARGASELAKRHDLSDTSLEVDIRERVVIVQGTKTTPTGRIVRDVGAVSFDPERPAELARAVKAAATSAHRRTTLRAVGIFINEPEDGGPLDA